MLFKEAYIWGQFRDNKIPDIYVQSCKHWEKYIDEIRTRFSHGITKIDKVALHIRRGDYLKATQFHANLWGTGYYEDAIQTLPGDTKFLVFCKDNQSAAQDDEDHEWCLENLPNILPKYRFVMHKHTTEEEDLNAMASCKGIIGANSSFSWWAAMLGDPNKVVIMPKEERWFVDGKIRTELLPGWIMI